MCPVTFSNKHQAGLSVLTISSTHGQMWRSSCAPRRFPDVEKGWHGYPPQTRSTAGSSFALTVLASSHLGTLGQCFCSTFLQNVSISICPTHVSPALSRPIENPPMPAHMSINFILQHREKLRVTAQRTSFVRVKRKRPRSGKVRTHVLVFAFPYVVTHTWLARLTHAIR